MVVTLKPVLEIVQRALKPTKVRAFKGDKTFTQEI